jgi:hypothetical protein
MTGTTPNPKVEAICAKPQWFQRDPITGNFVQAEPPQQFTTEQLQQMLEQRAADATLLREQERRMADLQMVADLALNTLTQFEPGDSRAVSDEFVAMAAIQCGQTDRLDECREIIRAALGGSHAE